jgi:phosphoribosylanthranilate isomerase
VTRIKVCGLTRREDALYAAALGVDALGFVFAASSRRRADTGTVAAIVAELPPFVTAVGVFQDQPAAEVRRIAAECRLDLVQLHGSEGSAYIRDLGLKVLVAVSLTRREDLARLREYPAACAFLLDAGAGGARGGSGRTFDWEWAVEAKKFGRVVLAGGLGPGNVAEAVRRVRPWAVDAASGTEVTPGQKDPEKLRRFVERIREVDREMKPGFWDEGIETREEG